MKLPENCVWITRSDAPGYGPYREDPYIELPKSALKTIPLFLLRSLLRDAGLDAGRFGTQDWNPLGDIIGAGDKVLLKPNWVMDKNKLPGGGMDCLVTHTSVIEAVLYYVVKARPEKIVLGDAPIQDCDFENLVREGDLSKMIQQFKLMGYDIPIQDFRLTRKKGDYGQKEHAEPDEEKYCQFDLGPNSWLTPVTDNGTEFRVTNYNPDILKRHHFPGTHQYLITREVLDADVVINLPKLKTHMKAGITGALKNMVGINGFKEYLPHHRKGGSSAGGDCYRGGSLLKKLAEDALDRANRSKGVFRYFMYKKAAGMAVKFNFALLGGDRDLEGSWYGNDTVWRMCLDLQRILHYGNGDGNLARVPLRKVLTISDGIIAGEGNGPLAPGPVPLGIMTMGTNVAALDHVHCLLMGFDPRKIPLVDHAFEKSAWPLTDFSPDGIRVFADGEELPCPESIGRFSRAFTPPTGWKGHCERESG
jgi:uncharacterized protein (DUF362 family)